MKRSIFETKSNRSWYTGCNDDLVSAISCFSRLKYPNKKQLYLPLLLLTSAFDFWEDLSRTSSHDRSESSEKLRFLRDFKSVSNK